MNEPESDILQLTLRPKGEIYDFTWLRCCTFNVLNLSGEFETKPGRFIQFLLE